MKYFLLFTLLFSANLLYAQKSQNYLVLRTIMVQSQLFDHGNNIGLGLYGENLRLISTKRNLYWGNSIGIDWLPACNDPGNCVTWWYEFGFRASSYINKIIQKTENKELSVALGGHIFYGNILDYLVSIDPGGEVLYSEHQNQFEPGLGLLVTYSNSEINDRIKFSYGIDFFWFRQIHSLSASYRIGR